MWNITNHHQFGTHIPINEMVYKPAQSWCLRRGIDAEDECMKKIYGYLSMMDELVNNKNVSKK